jgi:hypothetical protein
VSRVSIGSEEQIQRATNQNTKHLGYEPAVARDTRPVFEQLFLRPFDIVHDIFSVAQLANGVSHFEGRGTHVLASMRWIISDCSLTMAASWPKLHTEY